MFSSLEPVDYFRSYLPRFGEMCRNESILVLSRETTQACILLRDWHWPETALGPLGLHQTRFLPTVDGRCEFNYQAACCRLSASRASGKASLRFFSKKGLGCRWSDSETGRTLSHGLGGLLIVPTGAVFCAY